MGSTGRGNLPKSDRLAIIKKRQYFLAEARGTRGKALPRLCVLRAPARKIL